MRPARRNLVWLASYPKSGNTWVRILLSYLLAKSSCEVDINRLTVGKSAANLWPFEALECCVASELTHDEIDRLRPEAYRRYADQHSGLEFLKTHAAYRNNDNGEPIFPEDVTHLVVYLVRNPLDIVISWAHHLGTNFDEAIEIMRSPFALGSTNSEFQWQHCESVLDWSSHVRSWTEQDRLPVHVVRYEDLLRNPRMSLRMMLRELGLSLGGPRIDQAIDLARIDRLQDQERTFGFVETPSTERAFFRAGRSGDWRSSLNKAQIARVLRHHGPEMRRFGYADMFEEAFPPDCNERG